LGRDWLSPRVGLFAAVLVATSAFFVHYLSEMRMYMLLAALTGFTVWVYLRIVNRNQSPGRLTWLALLAGAVGLIYTHYFGLIPLATIGFITWCSSPRTAAGGPWWA